MKISSKSILSPSRITYPREPPPISLPTSLSRSRSRRLTNSRSIKGATSPAMFPVVTGKKRGSGFDNPEPSSPKVTCIGQVRVKTKKKHVKKITNLSRRPNRSLRGPQNNSNSNSNNNNNNNKSNSNSSGDDNINNRQWVHIPLTICETLKTLGSEVSCLFPCLSTEKEMNVGKVRRHVFDELEIVNDVIIGNRDEGRASVCVPPKNALLLMRCRNDPLKMEALTSRVCKPMFEINDDENENEEVVVLDDVDNEEHDEGIEMLDINEEKDEEEEEFMVLNDVNTEQHDDGIEGISLEREMKRNIQEEEDQDEEQEQMMETSEEEEEDSFFVDNLFKENVVEDEEFEKEEEYHGMEVDQEELFETKELNLEKVKLFEEMLTEFGEIYEAYEEIEVVESNVEKDIHFEDEIEIGESNVEKVKHFEEKVEEMFTEFIESSESVEEAYEELVEDEDVEKSEIRESNIEQFEDEDVQETETGEPNVEKGKQSDEEFEEILLTEFIEEIEVENGENEEREKIEALPECLLLMMYEPKLSMEVSKETWVSRSDFTRSNSSKKKPPPPHPSTKPIDNNVTSMDAIQYESVAVAQQQPARSSCSFPAAPRSLSMIAVLEEKLVNVLGFEPLALTRCKSEPMRRAVESCSWQNQLEPPRRASFGVGMTGLGVCQFGS